MSGNNCTAVTEFIILGLTDDPTLHVILFVIFLGVYAITLVGNLTLIILIRNSSQLHTPMYLFLSHLAIYRHCIFLNCHTCYAQELPCGQNYNSSGRLCGPNVLWSTFGMAECFLLSVMAMIRIWLSVGPYSTSRTCLLRVCTLLLITSYLGGCVNTCVVTGCLLNQSFCGPNKINHFFCDYSPLVKLSYSQDNTVEILPATITGLVIVVTVLIIIISYVYILFSVLKINSSEGRSKTFSTSTSHLIAETLIYGTITFIYVLPKSSHTTDENKVVSVFYIVMIPMLNPFIYSLRNNEVKEALKKLMSRKYLFS